MTPTPSPKAARKNLPQIPDWAWEAISNESRAQEAISEVLFKTRESVHALEAEVARLKSWEEEHIRRGSCACSPSETRAEAAEARLAEVVRLLGSLFSVFGHSGLEPKYPSLTRQVSDLLASIDNDPAKRESGKNESGLTTGEQPNPGRDIPRTVAAANLGGVHSSEVPGHSVKVHPDGTICWEGCPGDRKPTHRPSAETTEKC